MEDREIVAFIEVQNRGSYNHTLQTGIMAAQLLYVQTTLHNQTMKAAVHGLYTTLKLVN